jgi:hypothetical protein
MNSTFHSSDISNKSTVPDLKLRYKECEGFVQLGVQ